MRLDMRWEEASRGLSARRHGDIVRPASDGKYRAGIIV